MRFTKATQPVYKLANQYVNRQPIYELFKFAIGSQHTYCNTENGLTSSCAIFCVEQCRAIHIQSVSHDCDFCDPISFINSVRIWLKLNSWSCIERAKIVAMIKHDLCPDTPL